MNANELADVFDTYEEPFNWGKQAQAMLRQQQAEIEALKAKAHEWYLIAMGKVNEK